jgi:hypothetical protein
MRRPALLFFAACGISLLQSATILAGTVQIEPFQLKNEHIRMEFAESGGIPKLINISRTDGSDAMRIDNDVFEILLLDDTRFTAADYNSDGPPKISAEAGKKIVRLNYKPKPSAGSKAPANVNVTYELEDGPFFRKSIYVDLNEKDFIDRLNVFRFSTNQIASRGGYGQPVFIGDWFFGMDYPNFYSRHSNDFTEPVFRYKHFYTIDLEDRDKYEPAPRNGLVDIFHFPGYPQQQKNGKWAIMSKRGVVGISEKQGENAELGLLDYITLTRKPPRSHLHYNNWYSPEAKAITVDSFVNGVHKTVSGKLAKYGAKLDAMVPDHGWQDTKTFTRIYQPKVDEAHDPLPEISEALRKQGTSLGIWIALDGTNNSTAHGIENVGYKPAIPKGKEIPYSWASGNKKWFDILDEKYIRDLKESIRFLIEGAKINYIKHDFNHNFSSDYITQRHSRERCIDITLDLLAYELSLDPEIYQNYTNGTWFSPFWLQYADSIWMMSGDSGGGGAWPQLCQKEGSTTYRDNWLIQSWNNPNTVRPLIPIANFMTHGIIFSKRKPYSDFKDSTHDWSNYVVMYFGRGTMVKELYLSTELMSEDFWKALGMAAGWAAENQHRLVNTLYVGGDPGAGKVYGYLSWVDGKALLIARNPDRLPQTLQVPFDETVYYRGTRGADFHARAIYPFVEQMPNKLVSGYTFSIEIPGDSVMVYDIQPGKPLTNKQITPTPLPPFTASKTDDKFEITLKVPNEQMKRCDLLVQFWASAVSDLKINNATAEPYRVNDGGRWTVSAYDLRNYRGKTVRLTGRVRNKEKALPKVSTEVWLLTDRPVKENKVTRNEKLPFSVSSGYRRQTQQLIKKDWIKTSP